MKVNQDLSTADCFEEDLWPAQVGTHKAEVSYLQGP